MKKLFVMVIMMVFVMSFNAFGAEKEYEYIKYYEDTVDSIHYGHEPVEEGKYYVSRFDDDDMNVYWHLDGNTISCAQYMHEDGITYRIVYDVTGITNGDEEIYFYDFGDGNEWVQVF